jgi:hypothetical protein
MSGIRHCCDSLPPGFEESISGVFPNLLRDDPMDQEKKLLFGVARTECINNARRSGAVLRLGCSSSRICDSKESKMEDKAPAAAAYKKYFEQ